MRLGLGIFAGFFLIVGLAALLTVQVFTEEVKPGVRQAMEDTMVDTAHVLAGLAAADLEAGTLPEGSFARAMSQSTGGHPNARIWGMSKDSFDYRVYITNVDGIVVYDSDGAAIGADYSRWNDVARTLRGQYGARSTRAVPEDDRSSVMYVAAPVRGRDGGILGVLTVAKPNRTIEPFIGRSQRRVWRAGLLLVGSAGGIGILCTLWLVGKLRRLRDYARRVSAGERATLALTGGGELEELGRAIETMRLKLEDKQYVERYVASLTHELKSPLTAIRGAAQLLEEPMEEPDRARFLQNIQAQTDRLHKLIEQLLALAEIEQRMGLKSLEPLGLGALARDVIDALEPRARAAGLTLALRAAPTPMVEGERLLIEQALRNLLDNALDFAPAGSTVEVHVGLVDGAPCIDVLDGGPGIPEFAQPRLFDRFFSLPRPRDGVGKGTGLGLCFVREVASLHHASVSVENRPEGGGHARLLFRRI